MDRKLVVAGMIVDAPRVLITRRRADQVLPGAWEFPGGKIEPGESPQDALRRELKEEIDVQVEVGQVWDVLYHRYETYEVVMLVYPCRLSGGVPRCLEVAELAWCEPKELRNYDILAADAPLVERLISEGVPVPRLNPKNAPPR